MGGIHALGLDPMLRLEKNTFWVGPLPEITSGPCRGIGMAGSGLLVLL